jgi:acyl-coenzyme A thioesterase PaaI-like protein
MLDDAAFYAANTLLTDRFLLTTSFNLQFLRPVRGGPLVAEGRWISGRKRVFVAEARLLDGDGEEVGRGTGTFMRSHIALAALPGYADGLRAAVAAAAAAS